MWNLAMTPFLLRQLWMLVETTQAQLLLNLDDRSLVQRLTHELQDRQPLNSEQETVVTAYIEAKLPLIRDVAQSRLSPCYH
jgi:hypothetical protein